MPQIFVAPIVFLLAVFSTDLAFADSAEEWLQARRSSTEALQEAIEAGADQADVIRARLVLADRAINQSTEKSNEHLVAAESLLVPGTDAHHFATAVRCQLEHRQGQASATQLCGELASHGPRTENPLVQAYRHLTLAYYYYREGQHPRSLVESEKALTLSQSVGDHDLIAGAHNGIGLHFATRLRPRMSVTHFETALEHARQMITPEFRYLVQLNLASSYTYLGRAETSLNLLREAKASPIVELYPTRQLVAASMIAQASVAAGQVAGAEAELLATIDAVSDVVLPDAMTFGYTGLGIVELAQRQPQKALASFDRVLEITGQDLATGLLHPRIQLVAVPYAMALRDVGRHDEAVTLLEAIIKAVPENEPDQLLVDATRELSVTLQAMGNTRAARSAAEQAARLETLLWDENFRYRVARLNVSLELDRQKIELELAQAREAALQARADKEAALKRQSWLIAGIVVAVILLLSSRYLQSRVAVTERAANERLESLVEQRTRELSDEMAQRLQVEVERRRLSEQLSEGEKMRVVGRLTAGVAHDFNNLMTIVSLSAENLSRAIAGGDNSKTNQLVGDILSAADSGARITDGLLAYVRKQPLRPEVLSLDIFLQESLPLIRNTLGERIAFSSYFEPCQVRVDKGQLTTSILNLILNAKDAMSEGGELSLQLHERPENAEILVCDTGTGMTEETRQQAFEPFFTTKESGEGAGLGLSMVYGFARQSGGNLTIDSIVGKGSVVTLSLPLATVEQEASEENRPQLNPGDRVLRVLVVEDRDFLLRMLELTLQQMGMDVEVASNADDALKVVDARGVPDLLICDVMMPGSTDGPGLARQLRERNADLPVLLISGFTESVDPAYGFLRKPFSMTELEQAIDEVLPRFSSRPDAVE